MRRMSVLMAAFLCWGTAGSFPTFAQDRVEGAIWESFAKNPKTDKWEKRGIFRCTTDGKVYVDGKVAGTHKTTKATVEIKITSAKVEANNGTFRGMRVAKDGTSWEGTYTKMDGTEVPVRLRMIVD